MKNLEIFFDIINLYACLYMHIKFCQNRTKIGSVRASFSKTGCHGISNFANFYRLRVIFESGYMRLLLSFFLPYVHLRLTVYLRIQYFLILNHSDWFLSQINAHCLFLIDCNTLEAKIYFVISKNVATGIKYQQHLQ